MRIVQVSDTHLTHRGGVTNQNFERLAAFINDELHPDLVVHTGDVSILSPDSAADRETARELLGRISAPLRVLPGNHDVGEPGEKPWAGFAATSARVAAFTGVFGPDHWVELVGGYAAIGLNSEILGTGLPEEQAQWDWLDSVAEQAGGRPALIFCHKPFWPPVPVATEHAISVPGAVLGRLARALDGVDVRVYASGHLHHYAVGQRGGALTVSAPSTAFVARGHHELSGPGLDQLGVVEYRCEAGQVEAYFRAVPDLTEGSPMAIGEFAAAAAEIGVTVDA
jgi:3',5'-cyclic AMP phosphodiesterase CpdA